MQKFWLWGAVLAAMGFAAVSGMHLTSAPQAYPRQIVPAQEPGKFRVLPYLQHPTSDAMSILWLSEKNAIAELEVEGVGYFYSTPELATALVYSEAEKKYIHSEQNLGQLHADLAKDTLPTLPYRHRIRVTGLAANQEYTYHVRQAGQPTFTARFKTAPHLTQASHIRFVVMSDMETQPESTGHFAIWGQSDPKQPLATTHESLKRPYLLDQTTGYQQTLKAVAEFSPHLCLIAGDLTAKGGRQLDWDEFWRHIAGAWGQLASQTAILPVMGNHDLYWHPEQDAPYHAAAVQRAYQKWQSYWEVPDNQASLVTAKGRYYRIDYGPVSIISLDSTNGDDQDVTKDTNLLLNGQAAGVPDFNPGSEQWQWAEQQLKDAQAKGQIIFVQWHHMAYGTGLHSLASGWAGIERGQDKHSGQAMRVYHPLMRQYGVVAVFSGHNELLETLQLDGVQYWDVGFSGDGLRGPGARPMTNDMPFDYLPQHAKPTHWSAHGDASEIWQGQRLIKGGKHYGFLAVSVEPITHADARYKITMQPHYSLPILDQTGQFTGKFSQLQYDKQVSVLHK